MSNHKLHVNAELEKAKTRLLQAFDHIYTHEGFGQLEVEMRFLKKGQKEILIRCGREYRYVVDKMNNTENITSPINTNLIETKGGG